MTAKAATVSELDAKASAAADEVLPASNVVEALRRVMRDLPAIGKDQSAAPQQGGYPYRGIEQITRHVQPLFARHGIVMAPRVDSAEVKDIVVAGKPWTDTILHVTYTVHGPGGDTLEVRTVGIGRDNSDKGANKAMTQAFKYALLQLLCVSDAKDDADGQTHEADAPAPRWEIGHAKQRLLAELDGNRDLAAEAWVALQGDRDWPGWERDFPKAALDAWVNAPAEADEGSGDSTDSESSPTDIPDPSEGEQ